MINRLFAVLICLLTFVPFTSAFPGNLDPFFGTGGVSLGQTAGDSFDQGFAAALQADGKMIIAGESQTNSSQFSSEPFNFIVARVNIDGTLDSSFGSNGISSRAIVGSSRAASVVVQPDGKIVIGGYSHFDSQTVAGFIRTFFLTRLNSNGTTDLSFGTNGIVTTSFYDQMMRAQIAGLALQSDGKIVAAGYTTAVASGGLVSIAATRYNTDGSLDGTFDGDGKTLININAVGNRGSSVLVQPDGKIVIGGSVRETTTSVTDFALVRLNTDGSPDTGFDGDGKLTTKFGTSTSAIVGIGLQTDGKVVAAGNSIEGSTRDLALARYNSDGSLDGAFDGDGKLTTNVGDDSAGGMRIQPDGKIVVCGQSFLAPNSFFAFLSVRYNSDGSLDNSYNGNGKVLTPVPDRLGKANAVLIAPDGKIVLAGHAYTFVNSNLALLRYNSAGILDNTFDTDGIKVIKSGNGSDLAFEIAVQPDGKIVAAGYGFDGFQQNVTVARFLPGGGLDTSFGTQGSVTQAFTELDTYANKVIVQPDGKILVSVGSYFPGRFITLRYNANGTPDNSFGTAGIASISVGATSDNAAGMALQPDGKIIVAGSTMDGSVGFPSLIRMNSDGALDSSFGSGGSVRLLYTQHTNTINTVALQSDGKILIGGSDSTTGSQGFFVGRLSSNGVHDSNFGDGGAAYATFGNFSAATSLAVEADGRITAAGYYSTDSSVARFNANGTLDSSFDGDGKLTIPAQGIIHFILNDVVIQRNGKIVLAGIARYGLVNDPDEDSAVLRLNQDGTPDTSFGSGGTVITSVGPYLNGLYSLALRPGGRILAGGYSSNGANNDFTLVQYRGDTSPGFDYDGDGKSDVSVFRPSSGDWYLLNSQTGYTGFHFGAAGDLLAPADLDGDGKTDVAVFRASVGGWYWLNSSNGSFSATTFGQTGDLPTPADYDGDGKADIAVFRPSTGDWYRMNSSNGQFVAVHFGSAEDKPALGDFDGDGKADISIFRPSTGSWYRLNSSNGDYVGVHFGVSEDKPAPADYDGDGKTDISVYRPSGGDWYRLNSSTGAFVATHFGNATDRPAAADFDGDGKADICVFRPSDGNWYQLNTTAGFGAVHFGISEDLPTPNAFVF